MMTAKQAKITLGILVAILLVGGSSYFAFKNYIQKSQPAVTKEQRAAGETIKATALSDPGTKRSGSEQPAPPVTAPDGTSTVEITITAKNQTDTQYLIRSMIALVDNQGECTLTLSKEGQRTVTLTSGVYAQATTSTCKGFNVPLAELPSAGTWNLQLDYANGSYKGSATDTIEVIL